MLTLIFIKRMILALLKQQLESVMVTRDERMQNFEENLSDSVSSNVRVVRAPCMGRCHQAPVVEVGKKHFVNADVS